MANTIVVYTKDNCPYCMWAKQLLDSRQLKYTEIPVDKDPAKLQEMLEVSGGRRTVPQIIINTKAIGGFDDLSALANSGELDKLLA